MLADYPLMQLIDLSLLWQMSSKLGQGLWLAMIDEMHLRRKIEQPTFCGINKGTADSFMFVPSATIQAAAA